MPRPFQLRESYINPLLTFINWGLSGTFHTVGALSARYFILFQEAKPSSFGYFARDLVEKTAVIEPINNCASLSESCYFECYAYEQFLFACHLMLIDVCVVLI